MEFHTTTEKDLIEVFFSAEKQLELSSYSASTCNEEVCLVYACPDGKALTLTVDLRSDGLSVVLVKTP